ncbi:DUF3419 family protein [Amycolatopsis sp. NPDC054798]
MKSEFEALVPHGILRYSQVWEDHRLLEAGLEISPQDNVLSICGAGCNVLALLLAGARSVTAIDVNSAQLALLNLKLAGIRKLAGHADFAQLLGAAECTDRLALYERVRDDLPENSRRYWEAHLGDLEAGVLTAGRLDQYLAKFRRHLDPVAAQGILDSATPQDRRRNYELMCTPETRELFEQHFSRENMQEEGRDPQQFKHAPPLDTARHFWDRFRWVCTKLDNRENFYLEFLLTGRYASLDHGPPYLRPANFERLRRLIGKVRIVHSSVEEFFESTSEEFTKMALSDIFEYMSQKDAELLMESVARHLSSKGRFAFWTLLADRTPPASLHCRQKIGHDLPDSPALPDRSWFYNSFNVYELN